MKKSDSLRTVSWVISKTFLPGRMNILFHGICLKDVRYVCNIRLDEAGGERWFPLSLPGRWLLLFQQSPNRDFLEMISKVVDSFALNALRVISSGHDWTISPEPEFFSKKIQARTINF